MIDVKFDKKDHSLIPHEKEKEQEIKEESKLNNDISTYKSM
jgi:hypothetical protein